MFVRVETTEDKLYSMLTPVVEGLGYELVGIDYRNNPRNGLLRIYIDQEGGIDVEDCAEVSRQVSGVLDVEDPIQIQYNLEVSSPGLDRPIFKICDYSRFLGNKVKIQLDGPYEGRRKVVGSIVGVDQSENVLVDVDGEEFVVPYERISKAKLVYEGK